MTVALWTTENGSFTDWQRIRVVECGLAMMLCFETLAKEQTQYRIARLYKSQTVDNLPDGSARRWSSLE